MRPFTLVRDTDITGISGTGKVAEGVVFSDGWCALHWTGHIRTTTVFQSLEDLVEIHGHHGSTRVVFDDEAKLVQIPKPHLEMGAEGSDAEVVAVTNGVGVAEEGARLAYDRVREILAPPGWTAHACFWSHGTVSLTIRSPARFLRTIHSEKWTDTHFEEDKVSLEIARGLVKVQNATREDSGVDVYVDGVAYRATRGSYYTTRAVDHA